jgi:hypothetical protein
MVNAKLQLKSSVAPTTKTNRNLFEKQKFTRHVAVCTPQIWSNRFNGKTEKKVFC